jgi:predicted AlkP superfamily pyrophosphatase or phosphodiesterase
MKKLVAFVLVLLCGGRMLAEPPRPTQAPPPILVLVSLDGFRWDYIDRMPAPNLKALAARGVRAKELIPSFPVLTFPNHYTIVTGLYPEHHGIVGNNVVDPVSSIRFSMSSESVKDSHWWGGEPLWVTAIRQGRRAASMFWPGAEAAINNVRPTFWKPFDAQLPAPDRAAQVLEWLALPASERPSLIALYLDDVDHAGHDYGPDAPELAAAAARLDGALGLLVAGITRRGRAARTTVVVVSDHGMTTLSTDRVVWLDDYLDVAGVDLIEAGGILELAPATGSVDEVYQRLHGKHPHLAIYKREDVPARLHYSANARIPPIIGIPDDGWMVTTRQREQRRRDRPDAKPERGTHGFDPADRNMHAIFIAAGPAVRQGVVVEPFENVHVYDFLCAVLKLTPAPNDGNPAVSRSFLR